VTEFGISPSDHDVLLRELVHRVNNEFTSVINSFSRAAARSSNAEVKATLNGAIEMLHSYVEVHRALKRPNSDTQVDAAAYLHRLCAVMSRTKLKQKGIDLLFDSAPLTLESDHSWYLGLIVYELVTNATRHAFANRGGEVRVELRCAGQLVECKVKDNGAGLSNFRRGEGLSIVARLASALGGTVQHQFEPGESAFLLVFPRNAAAVFSGEAERKQVQLRFSDAGMSPGSTSSPARSSKASLLPSIHDRDGWLRWSVEACRSAKARE
jgi:two-component sensor histidine kinase